MPSECWRVDVRLVSPNATSSRWINTILFQMRQELFHYSPSQPVLSFLTPSLPPGYLSECICIYMGPSSTVPRGPVLEQFPYNVIIGL